MMNETDPNDRRRQRVEEYVFQTIPRISNLIDQVTTTSIEIERVGERIHVDFAIAELQRARECISDAARVLNEEIREHGE